MDIQQAALQRLPAPIQCVHSQADSDVTAEDQQPVTRRRAKWKQQAAEPKWTNTSVVQASAWSGPGFMQHYRFRLFDAVGQCELGLPW